MNEKTEEKLRIHILKRNSKHKNITSMIAMMTMMLTTCDDFGMELCGMIYSDTGNKISTHRRDEYEWMSEWMNERNLDERDE